MLKCDRNPFCARLASQSKSNFRGINRAATIYCIQAVRLRGGVSLGKAAGSQ